MKRYVKDLKSDIAPSEGRTALDGWPTDSPGEGLTWAGSFCSLEGELQSYTSSGEISIRLQGGIYSQNGSNTVPGWIDVETMTKQKPAIMDIFLVGTRPLPQADITCLCRHPIHKDYLVAATKDSHLLLLDASLTSNLKVLNKTKLDNQVGSLVCCGDLLLGLEKPSGNTLYKFKIESTHQHEPQFVLAGRIPLPVSLAALAEYDFASALGITAEGIIYHLRLPRSRRSSQLQSLVIGEGMKQIVRLGNRQVTIAKFAGQIRSIYRAIKTRQHPWRHLYCREVNFIGFAYDGKHYWSVRKPYQKTEAGILLLYNQEGTLINSFITQPEVSLSSLNYCHNNLLVLDFEHQQLHQYYLADTMEPVAALAPLAPYHPGYLPAGTPVTGGIHDLCLLYIGGEGKSSVHRYDLHKLKPLVGYVNPAGAVQDFFMDGFLLLAQYSPLLNGRSFGVDLAGPPSRREDWVALFNEYFHEKANLQALEASVRETSRQLDGGRSKPVKVVLAIPTADRRCSDWDNKGYSLAKDSHRVEVTHWAIRELLDRWKKAKFRHLVLAGFYYMTEQGTWGDPVLHTFPRLCRQYGLCSFAIPGITSSWSTEFSRAGFDCVVFQSSHAFWQPPLRPARYLLKCAGRIAREFGMGMEVELPYDVLQTAGRQKLRDYLEMANIQGWAGAFKAYFQSYNLIKTLAESTTPENRQLYDDLYHISRISRQQKANLVRLSRDKIAVDCWGKWTGDTGQVFLRLNIEGHQGIIKLKGLTVE